MNDNIMITRMASRIRRSIGVCWRKFFDRERIETPGDRRE